MGRGTSPFTPAGRDAGLRRLRTFNRILIGAAVAATGLLTDVAAQAFPGHKRAVAPPASTARVATPRTDPATRRRRARRRDHAAHHRLHPPAQAPQPGPAPQQPAAAAQSGPAPQPAPAAQPAPSAPAPVVSGGS